MRSLLILLLLSLACTAQAALPITEITSDTGVKAWLMEDKTLPIVTLKIQFGKMGAAYDPKDLNGTAAFMSSLFNEGAGDKNALAFQQAMEDSAIHLTAEAGEDDLVLHLQTLVEHEDKAFSLLADVINKPRFDEEAVERMRAEILSLIRQEEASPNYIASKEWKKRAFAHHPYQNLIYGSTESINLIKRTDIMEAYNQLKCSKKYIGIVGNITKETATKMLSLLFPYKPCANSVAEVHAVTIASGGQKPVVIEKPVPQTIIEAGFPALARTDKDYYAQVVMNHIFGGGTLTSRLIKTIRDRHGLAYYAYSDINLLDNASFISVVFATRNEAAFEALKLFYGELDTLKTQGVTEMEVAEAKNYLTGSFPLSLSTQTALVNYLVDMQKQNLGIDYLEKRNSLINQVTQQQVNEVAKRLIPANPYPLTIMVGEPEQEK